MTTVEVLNTLREAKQELKERFGIEEIALFGSYARNDFNENSDVDLTILKIEKKDYFKRANAIYFLEELLNKKVDMGYFSSIRRVIQKHVEKEMIYV